MANQEPVRLEIKRYLSAGAGLDALHGAELSLNLPKLPRTLS